jgi:hypothetical protein
VPRRGISFDLNDSGFTRNREPFGRSGPLFHLGEAGNRTDPEFDLRSASHGQVFGRQCRQRELQAHRVTSLKQLKIFDSLWYVESWGLWITHVAAAGEKEAAERDETGPHQRM